MINTKKEWIHYYKVAHSKVIDILAKKSQQHNLLTFSDQ